MKTGVWVKNVVVICISLLLLGKSVVPPADNREQIRAFTRMIEFDYITWTLDAVWVKIQQGSTKAAAFLSNEQHHQIVKNYLALIDQINAYENNIELIYSDPEINDPARATAELSQELSYLKALRNKLGPISEAIIQKQLGEVLSDMGLSAGGQPVPPVLYHISPMPFALIVSPRDVIRQDADISLIPDLSLEDIVALEQNVETELDVSALVEHIGGVGIYPTMVMSTSDLPWLLEVVAHEWTHNYLTLRPLGVNYFTSSELRTMNETVASIVGKEISEMILERYYPEYIVQAEVQAQSGKEASQIEEDTRVEPETPQFDFRAEMHSTRVVVDQMLAEGKVDEAEAYMEEKREMFWEHGYRIRRLNQAYFAFHGAYADMPGGAAGEDPVGPAVREFREQCDSLADFLFRMSWMTSFDDLQRALK